MNEIEKLYENADCKKEVIKGCYDYYSKLGIDIWKENDCKGKNCDTCKKDKSIKRYPSFTAEKQLELLKICFDKYGEIGKVRNVDRCMLYISPNAEEDDTFIVTDYINFETWDESIAGLINNLWCNLTEEEKQQIKEILDN